MNKVYVVIAFDGESDNVLKVFKSKDKAEEYAMSYEEGQEEVYGYKYDSCRVVEFEVIS